MAHENKYDEFEQYLRATEPEPRERAALWQTAIGLQKVDGLEMSDYLVEPAKKHIEVEVNIDDVDILISTYYKSEAACEIPDDVKESFLVFPQCSCTRQLSQCGQGDRINQ